MATLKETIKITQELRPCYVDGKKALFHTWVKKEVEIIKLGENVSCAAMNVKNIIDIYEQKHVLPEYCTLDKVQMVFAIVEYENGECAEVEPSSVKFADNKIKEYAF